jgi:hypothetical protein
VRGEWVILTAIEAEFCEWMGKERYWLRRKTDSKHTNNWSGTDADGIANDIMGLSGECAGKTFLWMTLWRNALEKDTTKLFDLPDLEHPLALIDVKTIPTLGRQLIAPPGKVKNNWVYLLVSAEEKPRYLIIGWCWGSVLAAAPVKPLQAGRPCHQIRSDSPLLRDPLELRSALQGHTSFFPK